MECRLFICEEPPPAEPMINVNISSFVSKIPVNEQIRNLEDELEEKEIIIERLRRDLREANTKLKIAEENLASQITQVCIFLNKLYLMTVVE